MQYNMLSRKKIVNSRFIGNIYQTSQGLYCINPADQVVSKELVMTGMYSAMELKNIGRLVNSQSDILLLGGHIGALCIPLSKEVRKMVVLEANPESFELLQINIALNHASNITAHNLAANHEFGTLDFVINTVNSGGSKRLPIERSEMYFYDNPEVRKIQAVRLDDFLHGQSFDLVFMDIEGSEYFAMQGMPRLLQHASAVVVEFIPHHLRNVAGISAFQFAACLDGFQTLISSSHKIVGHGKEEIYVILENMMRDDLSDQGLIFHKKKINISFS